jgi:hypothetical protein
LIQRNSGSDAEQIRKNVNTRRLRARVTHIPIWLYRHLSLAIKTLTLPAMEAAVAA